MVPEINVPWLKPFDETKQETSSNKVCTMESQANKDGEQAGVKRRYSDESGVSEDCVVTKKQKVEDDLESSGVEEEKQKENLLQSDQKVQNKEDPQNIAAEQTKQNTKMERREENLGQDFSPEDGKNVLHKSELEKVRISFEPVVIKQIIPDPSKNRTGKRKKTKSKTT